MLRRKLLQNPVTDVKKMKREENELLDLSVHNCAPSEVSKYFPNLNRSLQLPIPISIDDQLLQLQFKLNADLKTLNFLKPPIEYIYNPLEYAYEPNVVYIKKYCTSPKKILFVGMNPGPFGMCQTGVPFGDPRWVRDWLNVDGVVNKPPVECPERKILGFFSQRKEQSGDRFWGLFRTLCALPENFFRYAFVINYCPLAFMRGNGQNVTPGEIKNLQDRKELEAICDSHYLNLVRLLHPEIIIPIGEYMERRTRELCKNPDINVKVIRMPHPSPRAVNNQNWAEKAEAFLRVNNLICYFQNQ